MTLRDPHAALAEQSSFVGYLIGVAGAARCVRELARVDLVDSPPGAPVDDFVHLLLGIASLGDAISRLAETAPSEQDWCASEIPDPGRWLR